ncbi:MAG: hypothetical protein KAT90_08430 [Gammaproteobacteria bacterium]|nr:hypothetical protein [Gammaproteobacteria bacterium]
MSFLQIAVFFIKTVGAGTLCVYSAFSLAVQPKDFYASTTDKPDAVSRSHKLTTGHVKAGSPNENKLTSLFYPLYVEKGPATDCSFVSAFMLMVKHDPDYPYKILRTDGDVYFINYPGLDTEIKISKSDLERFYGVVESKKTWRYFFKEGYIPPGMEILRAAYYDYQRMMGLRPPQYSVYTGGKPIQDLMILSGIEIGGKIVAVQGYSDIPPERISFANGLEQKINVQLKDGLFTYRNDGYSDEVADPFSVLNGNLSSYLISVSSMREIGLLANLFGKRIIENHAYYFLGVDSDDNYILGDSYNTKQPVHISKQEFLEKFNGIYYTKISTKD